MKLKLFNLIRMKLFHSHVTSIYILGIYISKTNGNHGAKVVTVFSEANIISFLVFKKPKFLGIIGLFHIFFKFHAAHFAQPLVILDILQSKSSHSPEIVMDFCLRLVTVCLYILVVSCMTSAQTWRSFYPLLFILSF